MKLLQAILKGAEVLAVVKALSPPAPTKLIVLTNRNGSCRATPRASFSASSMDLFVGNATVRGRDWHKLLDAPFLILDVTV